MKITIKDKKQIIKELAQEEGFKHSYMGSWDLATTNRFIKVYDIVRITKSIGVTLLGLTKTMEVYFNDGSTKTFTYVE